MSLDLFSTSPEEFGGEARLPASLSDILSTGFETLPYFSSSRTDAKFKSYNKALSEARSEFKDITGQTYDDIIPPDVKGNFTREMEFLDNYIIQRRVEEPEKYNKVKTTEDIVRRSYEIAQEAQAEFQSLVVSRDDFLGSTTAFLTEFGNAALDPVNIAATLIPAGRATSFIGAFLREAGVNALAETAMQPFVIDWQEKIGNQYGLTDAAQNIALAGLVGGTFGVAGRAIEIGPSVAMRKLASNESVPAPIREWAKDVARGYDITSSRPRGVDISMEEHTRNVEVAFDALQNNKPIISTKLQGGSTRGVIAAEGGLPDLIVAQDIIDSTVTVQRNPAISGEVPVDKVNEVSLSSEIKTNISKQEVELKRLNQQIKSLDKRIKSSEENGFDTGLKTKKDPGSEEALLDIERLKESRKALANDIEARQKTISVAKERLEDTSIVGADPAFSDFVLTKRQGDIEPLPTNRQFDELVPYNRTPNLEALEQTIKEQETGATLVSAEADFERIVLEDPNFKVFNDEGDEITLAQVKENIAQRKNILNAISVCGVG